MRNTGSTRPSNWPTTRRALTAAVLFSATACACISASAQVAASPVAPPNATASTLPADNASLNLPEAPGYSAHDAIGNSGSSSAGETLPASSTEKFSSPAASSAQAPSTPAEATRSQRYPIPGQTAPVLTAGDKVRMGLTGAFSYTTIIGWVASAGYEQLTNGSPNFGTDRGAFGQRLWSSAARATSENLLADSVFAPMFHEDPRYYRLGPTHKFFPRLVYSATRSIITRSDSGAAVPNFSQILGNAGGAALTYAYYPQVNRTAKDTVETFGSSLGGTALGDVVAEFFGHILFNRDKD